MHKTTARVLSLVFHYRSVYLKSARLVFLFHLVEILRIFSHLARFTDKECRGTHARVTHQTSDKAVYLWSESNGFIFTNLIVFSLSRLRQLILSDYKHQWSWSSAVGDLRGDPLCLVVLQKSNLSAQSVARFSLGNKIICQNTAWAHFREWSTFLRVMP